MGATKTEYFSKKQNDMAALAKALAHPARIAIIEFLLSVDSCICGDIVSRLPLAQPTVSQHLKELRTAGLIKGCPEGTTTCYCIEGTAAAKLRQWIGKVADKVSKTNTSC